MPDSGEDSRSTAVGRKRHRHGDSGEPQRRMTEQKAGKRQRLAEWFPGYEASSYTSSRRSSKESGEISSSASYDSPQVRPPSRDIVIPVNFSLQHLARRGSSLSSQSRPKDQNDFPHDANASVNPANSSGVVKRPHIDRGGGSGGDEEESSSTGSSESSDSSNDSSASDTGETNAIVVSRAQTPPNQQMVPTHQDRITVHQAHARSPCPCCGQAGHSYDNCSLRTCVHCGARDKHASTGCPTWRKCGRCRQRGHDARACKNINVNPARLDDRCDHCGGRDHVEEECLQILYAMSVDERPTPQIPADRMFKSCYACGASGYTNWGHWGDDCPTLPYSQRHAQKSIWSDKHASKYIIGGIPSFHLREEAKVPGSEVNSTLWQSALFDDMKDN